MHTSNQTRLSVNINKIALIRNSRTGNMPDLSRIAQDCESFGAQGITIHPRPDERHIRFSDIPVLKALVKTEFNIEGYPNDRYMDACIAHQPHQATLVPDSPDALTSDQGWDTIRHQDFLQETVQRLQAAGIRVSLFVDAREEMVEAAASTGANRIEFYTGQYAKDFTKDPAAAVEAHTRCATLATSLGLGVNAGHDLNLENLAYYTQNVPGLLEVSIGHALVCDALYYGLQNTIQMYLRKLS